MFRAARLDETMGAPSCGCNAGELAKNSFAAPLAWLPKAAMGEWD